MKKEKSLLFIVPLLMSISSADHINSLKYTLKSTGGTTLIYQVISSGTKTITCYGHQTKDVAAEFKIHYDFLEKHKDYAPYNGYKASFHLIYRFDVFLNNQVKYKGGVGNRFDGVNPSYLNGISITTTYNSSNFSNRKFNRTPNRDMVDALGKYLVLRDNNPTCGLYNTNIYNRVTETSVNFDANDGYTSNSYSTHWKDGITNLDFNNLNCRLLAKITDDYTETSSSFKNSMNILYGYPITQNANGERNVDPHRNKLYSGPNKNGSPFRFSFFICENIQNDAVFSSVQTNIKVNTTHGSTVWLDTFESNNEITIKLL